MAENPESQPTKQSARLTLKQFQEAVLPRLDKLERILHEQPHAQGKLRSELTEQAKHQQEQTEHSIQEIEETLTQHQQEMEQLRQAMTAQSEQQQAPPQSPKICLDPVDLDFGTMEPNTSKTLQTSVSNCGGQQLHWSTGGDGLKLDVREGRLDSKQSQPINVTLDTGSMKLNSGSNSCWFTLTALMAAP